MKRVIMSSIRKAWIIRNYLYFVYVIRLIWSIQWWFYANVKTPLVATFIQVFSNIRNVSGRKNWDIA